MRVRNSLGSVFSGTIGKDTVAVEGPTMNYLRAYVVPHDPKSERQLEQRDRLRQAMRVWKRMSPVQQGFYRHLDRPRIGVHVFKGRAIHALLAGEPIESPVRMAWTVEGGPVERGRLLVRRHKTVLFAPSLTEPTVEVALTPSDAPYTFVLVKGAEEDEVFTMIRPSVSAPLPVVQSATLGIKLIPVTPEVAATPPTAPP